MTIAEGTVAQGPLCGGDTFALVGASSRRGDGGSKIYVKEMFGPTINWLGNSSKFVDSSAVPW